MINKDFVELPNWSLAIAMICAATNMNQSEFADSSGIARSLVNGLINGNRGVRLSYIIGKKIEQYAYQFLADAQIREVGLSTMSNLVTPKKLSSLLCDHWGNGEDDSNVLYGDTIIPISEEALDELGLEFDQQINKATLIAILHLRDDDAKAEEADRQAALLNL